MLMGVANAQIKGTKWEANWPDGITDNWYYRYLRGFKLSTGTSRPLDISCAKWTTSANMKIHYDVVVEVLVRLKIAVQNPDFIQDYEGIKGEEIFIVKPERLFSWDKTKVALNMRAASKAKAEHMVLVGPTDDGSMLASNSSVTARGIGGSFSSSHSLPAFFIMMCASFALTKLRRRTDINADQSRDKTALCGPLRNE